MHILPFALAAISAFSSGTLATVVPAKRASVCNGRAELCSRPYGDVVFLGSHDSYAVSTNPLALGRNQQVSVASQLALGVRLLQAQSHMKDGQLNFCHTSCVSALDTEKRRAHLDNEVSRSSLTEVALWTISMSSRTSWTPTQLRLSLSSSPTRRGVSPSDVWKPAFDQAGLTPLAYVPPHQPMKRTEWPTLGQLIDSGKRLIVFLDAGADTNKADFILPEFTHAWEPPFNSVDPTFPCRVDRTAGPLSPEDHLYMLNHFLDKKIIGDILIPDRDKATTTNGRASIFADANGCKQFAGGKQPNFVLLDWVDMGDGIGAVNQMNGF